jgi:multicomponent Na+:H+ antiporter subunit G
MSELIVDIISWPLIVAGSFFYLVGSIGLLRMPDVFTRMHATSVSDTFGAGLLIVGMMVQGGLTLVTAKLAVILMILFFTGPVATHAIARAARYAGIEPILDAKPEDSSSKP